MNSIRGLSLKNSGIDDLIDNLENFSCLGKRKQDVEWDELKMNYEKLVFVQNIFKKIEASDKDKLKFALEKFLFTIDEKTRYYLSEVNWWDPETDIYSEAQEIGNIFEKSLGISNPYDKLKALIDGYSKLFNILEDCGRCSIYYELNDPEFEKQFSL